MSMTARLRQLLKDDPFLIAPGCFNAGSARLVEQAGFPAVYISGAAVAGNYLGMPDMGLASMHEVLENARRIVQAVGIPAICDVDTGYGSALNVVRTVREFEAAGLAGVQLEDQVMPKKCGHTEGKLLVSKQEMVQKIRAAVETRRDPDFVLIARTDAIAVTGLADAIERMNAYREAGADVLFVEAPPTVEAMQTVTRSVPGLHLANMVEGGGKTPILPAAQLRQIGYRMAIYPVSAWMASIKAIQEILTVLRTEGTTAPCASRLVSFQEMFESVGRSACIKTERQYAADR